MIRPIFVRVQFPSAIEDKTITAVCKVVDIDKNDYLIEIPDKVRKFNSGIGWQDDGSNRNTEINKWYWWVRKERCKDCSQILRIE